MMSPYLKMPDINTHHSPPPASLADEDLAPSDLLGERPWSARRVEARPFATPNDAVRDV
jgi:hypothetical protein